MPFVAQGRAALACDSEKDSGREAGSEKAQEAVLSKHSSTRPKRSIMEVQPGQYEGWDKK
jgi:hypothetical protein